MLSIDLLYYEDCPHYKEAEKALKEVLDEENVDAEVHMVRVEYGAQADIHGFIGSPTIRINGQDLEPEVNSEATYQGHCRIYMHKDQPFESPPKEMIRAALTRFTS
ncbi:MAG: DF family (seleno)protein [Halobacteriota archaeon]